jgi:hypothetical protein
MKDYMFTFGSDHHPIQNAYVRIIGASEDTARALMVDLYGRQWAFQYPWNDADTHSMIERWDMTCVRTVTVTVSAEVR